MDVQECIMDFYICDQNETVVTYYSYPALASLTNLNDILTHYNHMLSLKHERKWKWIVDGENYKSTKDNSFLDTKFIKKLLSILEDNYDSLDNIYIKNISFSLKAVIAIVLPFVNKKVKQKLIFIK